MQRSRRQALRFALNAIILAIVVSLSAAFKGCTLTLTAIENTINTYMPVILQAIAGVFAIFDPPLAAILMPLFTLVQAGVAAVEAAIANWKDADATEKPGLVGDIIAALQTAQTSLANFLAAIKVHASGPIYIAASALIPLILGVLQSFVNRLTPAVPASAKFKVRAAVTVNGAAIVPLELSAADFKKQFNATAVKNSVPQAQIK